MVLLSIKNALISRLTCSIEEAFCPAVTVLIIPGKSTTVKSQESGDINSTMTLSVEKLLDPQSSCIIRSIKMPSSTTSRAGIGFGFKLVETKADQGSPARARFITIRIGHRVTNPEPLGKGMPDNASSTLDLPEDWSPMTQICGIFNYTTEKAKKYHHKTNIDTRE